MQIRNMSHASTLVYKCEPRMFFRYLLIQSHHCKKVTLHFFHVEVRETSKSPPPFQPFKTHATNTRGHQFCFPPTPPHSYPPKFVCPGPNCFRVLRSGSGGSQRTRLPPLLAEPSFRSQCVRVCVSAWSSRLLGSISFSGVL